MNSNLENSLKIDLVSHLAHVEGLGKYIYEYILTQCINIYLCGDGRTLLRNALTG